MSLLPPSPLLDEAITPPDWDHVDDHKVIHHILNNLTDVVALIPPDVPTNLVRHVATWGDDANDGLTVSTAMATVQAAHADVVAITGEARPICVIYVEPGVYTFASKLIVYEREQIIATAGPGPGFVVNSQGVKFKAAAGFTDANVVESESWTVNTEYAHGSVLDGIIVDGNKAAGNTCNGIGICGFGEESMLRRTRAENCGGYGYAFVGSHAVGHLEDISAWRNKLGGYYFGPHPDGNTGAVAAGMSGSVRALGISGDENEKCFARIDGYYSIDFIGLKHEKRVASGDAGIIISDADVLAVYGAGAVAGAGGIKAHIKISGRSDPAAGGGVAGGDFVRITGTAHPSVQIASCIRQSWTNDLNDTVAALTFALASDGISRFDYCTNTSDRIRLVSRSLRVATTEFYDYQALGYHIRGRDLADTTTIWQVTNAGIARMVRYDAADAATEIVFGLTSDSAAARSNRTWKLTDGKGIQFGTTNGGNVGLAANEKIGKWGKTPDVQPTTAITGATRVGGGGTALTDTDTFDGYTIAQIVAALRRSGDLA